MVEGKYSIDCYLKALEEAVTHFRSNLGLSKGKLFNTLDYFVYHTPFTTMARKAHRHLVEIEYPDIDFARKERLFEDSFSLQVEPGLSGARANKVMEKLCKRI